MRTYFDDIIISSNGAFVKLTCRRKKERKKTDIETNRQTKEGSEGKVKKKRKKREKDNYSNTNGML